MDIFNNIGQSEQTQNTANLNDIDSRGDMATAVAISTAERVGTQELGIYQRQPQMNITHQASPDAYHIKLPRSSSKEQPFTARTYVTQ